jgi:hypothetical protein
VIDFPPPDVFIVCIESRPDYPPGVHMLTMKTLKQLGKIASDYEATEARRLKFEGALVKDHKDFKVRPSFPDSEVGFLVEFRRDCPAASVSGKGR